MLIEDSDLNYDSNYGIFLGTATGAIISATHATMIRTGNAIEHLIEDEMVPDTFIGKISFRKPYDIQHGKKKKIVVDMVYEDEKQICIYEIKLGDTFDTKKAPEEVRCLEKVQSHLQTVTDKDVNINLVCYMANTHEQIKIGFKGTLPKELNIWTGQEFAEDYNFNYNNPLKTLSKNIKENQEYLLEYMLKNMPQKIVSKLIMKRKVLNDGMVRKIHRL